MKFLNVLGLQIVLSTVGCVGYEALYISTPAECVLFRIILVLRDRIFATCNRKQMLIQYKHYNILNGIAEWQSENVAL